MPYTVDETIAEIGLSLRNIEPLNTARAASIVGQIEEKFLLAGDERWWERLRAAQSLWFENSSGRGSSLVEALCPGGACYLVDIYREFGRVYLTTTPIAARLLHDWFYGEFLLADTDLSWILIENHHEIFYGCGEPIQSRMLAQSSAPGALSETIGG